MGTPRHARGEHEDEETYIILLMRVFEISNRSANASIIQSVEVGGIVMRDAHAQTACTLHSMMNARIEG
eukprot:scaffold55908_cov32-Tisochrysis_lutea.AAC.5